MANKTEYEKHFDKILGKKLQEQRKILKMTQQYAANQSGESRQWVSDTERGVKTPSIYLLCQYVHYAGVDIHAVFDGVFNEFFPYMEKIRKEEEEEKLNTLLKRLKKRKGK